MSSIPQKLEVVLAVASGSDWWGKKQNGLIESRISGMDAIIHGFLPNRNSKFEVVNLVVDGFIKIIYCS